MSVRIECRRRYGIITNGGFGPQILAKAKSKGMARMALKALAFGKWPAGMKESDRTYPKCWYQPIDDREMARQALRFTLNRRSPPQFPLATSASSIWRWNWCPRRYPS